MRRTGVVFLGVVLLFAGCGTDSAPPPEELSPAWQESVLPMPDGGPGAVRVRDVAACSGVWFVVGAVRDSSGGTRPAAWSSGDGAGWRPLTVEPSTFYGRQNVLSAVACRDGRAVAVGAKTGGVHGNPRTSSWWSPASGVLREGAGSFELFGGPEAVNVGRPAAGPAGFLIAGNRVSGAAVWLSPDGAAFRLRAGVPGLMSDSSGSTWAYDGVGVPGGWLLVGAVRSRGRTDRDPLGWRSADGAVWSRVPAEATSTAHEELQRVVVLGDVPVAVGVSGPAFGVWRLKEARWRPVGSFGAVRRAGAAAVTALAVVDGRLFCVTSDGTAYSSWVSEDGGSRWRPVALPLRVALSPEGAVVAAAEGGRVVLVADDGAATRSFWAVLP